MRCPPQLKISEWSVVVAAVVLGVALLGAPGDAAWAQEACDTGVTQDGVTTFTCTTGPYNDGIQRHVPLPNDAKLIIGAEDGAGAGPDVSVRGSTDDERWTVGFTGNGNVEVVVGRNAKIETRGSGTADPIANAANIRIHTGSRGSGASKVVLSGRLVMGSSAFYDNGAAWRQTGIIAGAGVAENEGGVHVVLREGSAIEHAPSGADGHAGGHGIHADTWGLGSVQVETEDGSLIDTSAEGGWGILGWIFSSTSTADVVITHRGTINTSVKRNGPDGFKGVGIVGVHSGAGAVTIASDGAIESVQAPGIIAYAAGAENTAAHAVTVGGGTVTTHGSTTIQALHRGTGGAFTITVAEGATVTAHTDTSGASCAPDCVADDATLREILDPRTLPGEKSNPGPWWEVETDADGNILSYAPRVRGISILRGGTPPPDGALPMDRVEVYGNVIATGSGSVGVHLPRGGRVIIGPRGDVRGGQYGVEIGGDSEDLEDRTVEVHGSVRGGSAGIHLEGGGMVIVGPQGQVIGASGVAILANDAGDLLVLYQADERGNIGTVSGEIKNDNTQAMTTVALDHDNDATTEAVVLASSSDDPATGQRPSVAVGAFDIASRFEDGGISTTQAFAPRAAVYEVLPRALLDLNRLSFRHQRVSAPRGGGGLWIRPEGTRVSYEPDLSTVGAEYDQSRWRLAIGLDVPLSGDDDGGLTAGVSMHHVRGSADVSISGGGGELVRQRSQLGAARRGALTSVKGSGHALGVEAGQRIGMGEGFVLTPRLRLVHTEIDFDDFTDAVGTQVSLKDGDRLDGALGLSAARESSGQDAGGMAQSSTIYGSMDLEHAFAIGTEVEVSGTALESEPERTSIRLRILIYINLPAYKV